MRRAKNFTSGVSRSPTGTTTQRRYSNLTGNKRRHSATEDTQDDDNDTRTPSTTALDDSPSLQFVTSFGLRTLLVEDIWFLEEGAAVILFFNENMLPPRYAKKWHKVSRDTAQENHLPTVTFDGRPYKQLSGWVHQNRLTEKVTGVKLYKDIIAAMNEALQFGLYFKFPIFSNTDANLLHPPTECIQELVTWFEVFTFPQAIFVQSDYHPERSWNSIFKRVKDDGTDRLTLLHRLVHETHGDRYMLSELRHIWERLSV